MQKTLNQFDSAVDVCRNIFEKKMKDYGTAWRLLRLPSITDQIYIKAQRIRGIETVGVTKIEESNRAEYIGIINYSVMALIQIELGVPDILLDNLDMSPEQTMLLYNKYIELSKQLMQNKNHDYGEAWRNMRISSLTDLVLMKLMRIKQIEDNQGKTLISEGIDANYYDIINYSVFALIKLEEEVG